MSIPWLNAAMDEPRSKNGARLLLFVLADRADDSGHSRYSIETLMVRTNLKKSAVHNAIRELVSLGLLWVGYKQAPKGCNIYRLLLTVHNPHRPQFNARPSRMWTQSIREPSDKGKTRGSLEQCRAFAIECGLAADDGAAFFHGKEGNGWKNGKNPVRDWKATFRCWQANGWHPSQKTAGMNGTNGHRQPKPKAIGSMSAQIAAHRQPAC